MCHNNPQQVILGFIVWASAANLAVQAMCDDGWRARGGTERVSSIRSKAAPSTRPSRGTGRLPPTEAPADSRMVQLSPSPRQPPSPREAKQHSAAPSALPPVDTAQENRAPRTRPQPPAKGQLRILVGPETRDAAPRRTPLRDSVRDHDVAPDVATEVSTGSAAPIHRDVPIHRKADPDQTTALDRDVSSDRDAPSGDVSDGDGRQDLTELILSPIIEAPDTGELNAVDWVPRVAAIPCGPAGSVQKETPSSQDTARRLEPLVLQRLPAPAESASQSPWVELLPPAAAIGQHPMPARPHRLGEGPWLFPARPPELPWRNRPAVEAAVPMGHACATCGRPDADCECQIAPGPADVWQDYPGPATRVARPAGRVTGSSVR